MSKSQENTLLDIEAPFVRSRPHDPASMDINRLEEAERYFRP
jgi:hypothetical protein